MNIEIKKSVKPVNYIDAINFMEERLEQIFKKKEKELIWTLEHEEIYTAGTSYSETDIIDKSIKVMNEALALNPNHPNFLNNLGTC